MNKECNLIWINVSSGDEQSNASNMMHISNKYTYLRYSENREKWEYLYPISLILWINLHNAYMQCIQTRKTEQILQTVQMLCLGILAKLTFSFIRLYALIRTFARNYLSDLPLILST